MSVKRVTIVVYDCRCGAHWMTRKGALEHDKEDAKDAKYMEGSWKQFSRLATALPHPFAVGVKYPKRRRTK